MAEWIEPKTDWAENDYFNVSDYNRIIGNIAYLKAYLDGLFANLTNVSLGEEKTYLSLIYAREMNAIEQALERLNSETYGLDIGETQTYKPNKPTPLWSEYNRLESAILLIYNTAVSHKENLTRMSYNMGNQKGVRV